MSAARTYTTNVCAHLAAPPRDDVRPHAVRRVARRAPARDPRRPQEHGLPAHGVHRGVLDAPQRARAQPRAHDERIDRRGGRAAAREEARPALRELGDVLHGPVHGRAAARDEAREEVADVARRVEGDRREGHPGLRAGDQRGLGEHCKLRKEASAGGAGVDGKNGRQASS